MRGNSYDTGSFVTYLRRNYYSLTVSLIFMLSILTDWYLLLATSLSILTLLMVLDRLGKAIVLRELMALHGTFICLLMPVLGYSVYNSSNLLARIWGRYMPIPQEQYFHFALPAMAAFCILLCWPIKANDATDQGSSLLKMLGRAELILEKMPNMSLYMIILGVVMFILTPYLPDSLQFVSNLIFWSSFAGILYLYFTPYHRYKKLITISFATVIIVNAVQTGMFTILVYMGITIFSFFLVGRVMPYWKKLAVFLSIVLALILIQGVKHSYRQLTWKREYEGNKVVLFGKLIADKISSSESLFARDAFFPVYYRTNQGFNIGIVMRRFPAVQDFDDGRNLGRSLIASVIPRILWPDKPEAGGKFNMKFYTGITLNGWSTNIGPLGEAYGSFGPYIGIVFMAVLGAFVRWAYRYVFKLSRRIPLLVLWIPVLFYQVTYSSEADTLQILNSLFKAAFFVWFLYQIRPQYFGIIKKHIGFSSRSQTAISGHSTGG